jgi:bacterioferritin
LVNGAGSAVDGERLLPDQLADLVGGSSSDSDAPVPIAPPVLALFTHYGSTSFGRVAHHASSAHLAENCDLVRRSKMAAIDKDRVVALLNGILEQELAGVIRYTHYSLLVFGYSRIPIVSWLRDQATESLTHAQQAGEMITLLGAYPSLAIGPLLDSHKHDVGDIMRESLETEAKALALYRELLSCVVGHSVVLEEYARQMIYAEELHASEVDKMLRKPGDVAAFQQTLQAFRPATP